MDLSQKLTALRTSAKLSQEQFAQKLGVTRQAVQKWEKGTALPDVHNLAEIAKIFRVTLDSLVLDSDIRVLEEMEHDKIAPSLEKIHNWELYSSALAIEYRQSIEEGLDIAAYEDLFSAVAKMPIGENREKIADVLFSIVRNAPTRPDYPYREPNDLEGIFALRDPAIAPEKRPIPGDIADKIAGAWYGRICGCLLGKPVECIRTDELIPLLKKSGNYPMHRYILSTDIDSAMAQTCKFRLLGKCYADTVDGMPADDDTNYTVLYQQLVEERGRDFTPDDVARKWLRSQCKDAYCTAERAAFRNFVNGYYPPVSAVYKNPYREWIGAQIRGDYFGYINPGDPEAAAAMAWKDACIAQVKNGIYGELFAASMIAEAAVESDLEKILLAGMSQIPMTSRLYERLSAVLQGYRDGVSEKEFFDDLHRRWNEYDQHDWCHTVSNAEIVAACLLYGKGDYTRSICMAVEQGFDTDCNGATVGSVLGMRGGLGAVGEEWRAPVKGKVHTGIFGLEVAKVDDLVAKTLKHLQ